MKTLKFLMVAAVAVPALTGSAFAQAPKPATPPAHAEDPCGPKAAPKSLHRRARAWPTRRPRP